MLKRILIITCFAFISSMLSAQILDAHYIQPDDYFISDRPLEGHSWIRINVAKMIEAPGPNTNGEAKFLRVHDGKEIWTRNYWQSRIASESEIKLGAVAIMFDYSSGGIYIPPKQRDDARTHSWFMAKVTDTSTLYKGHVLVSGGYNVSKNNIRLIGSPEVKTVEVAADIPSKPAAVIEKQDIATPSVPVQPAEPASTGGLRVVKAVYGGFLPENTVDVKDFLNTQIKDGKLTVKATDSFLRVKLNTGDEKSLQLQYQTKDGIFETVVIQGMETTIPNKTHRKVK
jgi:hypothetical protein